MEQPEKLERFAFLRQRYPKFSRKFWKNLDPEKLERQEKNFNTQDQFEEKGDLDKLIKNLEEIRKRLPQCKSLHYHLGEYRLRIMGVREETDGELEERKEAVREQNELAELLEAEEKAIQEKVEYHTYLELHEKFKSTEHTGGDRDAEIPNTREEGGGKQPVREAHNPNQGYKSTFSGRKW